MHLSDNEQEKELVALNEKIKKTELDLWTAQRKIEAIENEMRREESFHTKAIIEDMIDVSGYDKPAKKYKNELERSIELERRLDNSKSYVEMRVNVESLKEQIRDLLIELGSVKRQFKISEIISRTGE